ncbi:MAG: SCO family protein [Candidatus Methylomirabilota bacterium]|nr:SCO family protein [candidate division NC10 bacterium]PWB47295.1 MAG: SCO family protein [candidate division NC10 bacterium]
MSRRQFLGSLTGTLIGSTIIGSTSPAPPPSPSEGEGDGWGHADRCPPSMTVAEARRRRRFPNVVLRTHENTAVRFYDDLIKGKTVMINFMYTACKDDCLLTTANLAQVQNILGDRVGRDIFFYSITLDPAHDTPAVLKRYAHRFRVRPGWLFLTGTKDDIGRLRRAFGDDPSQDIRRSQHLNMVRYGIEPLERWEGCPALVPSESIARYITWLEPNKQGVGCGGVDSRWRRVVDGRRSMDSAACQRRFEPYRDVRRD